MHQVTFRQGFVRTILNQRGQQRLRDLIFQHITPDFRLGRNPENPVGGNGMESMYFSKKLDKADFVSIAVCR